MLNPLKLLRYLLFGEYIAFQPNYQTDILALVIFLISNAIIASAAVWNLSIVEDGAPSPACVNYTTD
jgi:hypothetical protein